MTQLLDLIIQIRLSVIHPVANIMNEALEIGDVLDLIIIKYDYKMWFIRYDKEWRGQDLDDNNNENTIY